MDVRISYLAGTDDVKAASLFIGRRGSVMRKAVGGGSRRFLIFIVSLVVVMLVLAIAIPPSPPPSPSRAPSGSAAILLLPLVFAVVVAVIFVAMARARKASYWRYLKTHGGLDERLGQTELELSDEGMLIEYATMRVLFKWNGISGVDEDDSYIYVSAGPLQAVAVPKRAFADPADAALFQDAVRGRMRPGSRLAVT